MLDISKLIVMQRPDDLPVATKPTGYRGWQHPSKPRRLSAIRQPFPLIPRNEWPARIAALKGKTIAERFELPAKDQNGLSLCWAYGSTRAVEYKRAQQQLPRLDLSPESIAGPCTNWHNQGGYASEAFQQFAKAGACETRFMNAPHSLQPQLWDPGWMKNATGQEVIDWIDLEYTDENGPFDNVITALLQTDDQGNQTECVAAGLGWWGHLVCFVAATIIPTANGPQYGVVIQNSWSPNWPRPGDNGFAVLDEPHATPDGAAIPVLVD